MRPQRKAQQAEAKAKGIPGREAETCLDELSGAMRAAIDALDSDLTEGWPSERVIEIIRIRLDRLDSGQPLGGMDRRNTRRGSTFDEATLQR